MHFDCHFDQKTNELSRPNKLYFVLTQVVYNEHNNVCLGIESTDNRVSPRKRKFGY